MEVISSLQNSLIKETKKLQQKKYRDEKGLFLAEGIRLVEEACKAGVLEYVFYDESLCRTSRGQELYQNITQTVDGGRCVPVAPQVLQHLAETETPQGLAAVVKKREAGLECLEYRGNLKAAENLENRDNLEYRESAIQWKNMVNRDNIVGLGNPKNSKGNGEELLLVCDGIQDPGNLGTMIRTAWAAGVSAVLCLPGTVDPYNGKSVRATMGGIFHVPILTGIQWPILRQWLRDKGYRIVAGVLEGSEEYHRVSYLGKVALIIGNEGQGLREVDPGEADHRVRIPLHQGAESLNAAVAAGILLYEMVRQRSS